MKKKKANENIESKDHDWSQVGINIRNFEISKSIQG